MDAVTVTSQENPALSSHVCKDERLPNVITVEEKIVTKGWNRYVRTVQRCLSCNKKFIDYSYIGYPTRFY